MTAQQAAEVEESKDVNAENQSVALKSRFVLKLVMGVVISVIAGTVVVKAIKQEQAQYATLQQNCNAASQTSSEKIKQLAQALEYCNAKYPTPPNRDFAKLAQHFPEQNAYPAIINCDVACELCDDDSDDAVWARLAKQVECLNINRQQFVEAGIIVAGLGGENGYVTTANYYHDGEFSAFMVRVVGTTGGDIPILLTKGHETLLYNQDGKHDCQTLEKLRDVGVTDFILERYILLNALWSYGSTVAGLLNCP